MNKGLWVTGGNVTADIIGVGEDVRIIKTVHGASVAADLSDQDLKTIREELAAVREAALKAATSPEHYKAIGDVKAAEDAAEKGDKQDLLLSLKSLGAWVLQISQDIGTSVVTKLIEKQLGG